MKPHISFENGRWGIWPNCRAYLMCEVPLLTSHLLRDLICPAQQNEEAARVGEQQNCGDGK